LKKLYLKINLKKKNQRKKIGEERIYTSYIHAPAAPITNNITEKKDAAPQSIFSGLLANTSALSSGQPLVFSSLPAIILNTPISDPMTANIKLNPLPKTEEKPFPVVPVKPAETKPKPNPEHLKKYEPTILQLQHLFPQHPLADLAGIAALCDGNLTRSLDMLLDGSKPTPEQVDYLAKAKAPTYKPDNYKYAAQLAQVQTILPKTPASQIKPVLDRTKGAVDETIMILMDK